MDINDLDTPDFAEAFKNALNEPTTEVATEPAPADDSPADAPIDTPAAEAPVAEPAAAEPVVKEVIKEVEKIVEKYPEFKNEETKALYELWLNGDKEAVRNYIKETEKDYKTMSDLDVRREALRKTNPSWSAAEVELEIRATYGDNIQKIDLTEIQKEDEDGKITDEYKEAVAHNKEVDRNLLLLSRDARDDRHRLIEQQSKIELPQIKKEEPAAPPATAPTEQEIAERQAKWEKSVEEQLPELKGIKQTIDDKEVEYSFSDDDKAELAAKMKAFNIFNFAKERGWQNEDGTTNVLKLAEDVQKLTKFDTISKAFATQVKTDATKKALAKIKNIDDKGRQSTDNEPQSLEEAFMQAKYGATA